MTNKIATDLTSVQTSAQTSVQTSAPFGNTSRVTALIAAGLATVLIAGCATQSSSSAVYRTGETQREQTVRMATVEAVRKVMIQRDSKGVGIVSGAVVGGLAGSTIGRGTGRDIAAVLGAVGGAVAGQAIEDKTNQREGLEITVKYDSGQVSVIVQEADVDVRPGDRVQVVGTGKNVRVAR